MPAEGIALYMKDGVVLAEASGFPMHAQAFVAESEKEITQFG
jgi:hypothetical protein